MKSCEDKDVRQSGVFFFTRGREREGRSLFTCRTVTCQVYVHLASVYGHHDWAVLFRFRYGFLLFFFDSEFISERETELKVDSIDSILPLLLLLHRFPFLSSSHRDPLVFFLSFVLCFPSNPFGFRSSFGHYYNPRSSSVSSFLFFLFFLFYRRGDLRCSFV